MRSFSPILRLDPFGDFYISVFRLRSIHLKGIERSREARLVNQLQMVRASSPPRRTRGTISESFTYTRLGHRAHLDYAR
jgi:hypothetical protein